MSSYTPSSTFRIWLAEVIRQKLPIFIICLSTSCLYLFWTSDRIALAIPVAGATVGGLAAWTILKQSDPHHLFERPTELKRGSILFLTQPKLAIALAFLYTATILVIHTVSLYERPIISYPLHGAIFAYIALTIFYQDNKVVTAFQLIPVAFVTYWSSQLIFPSGTSRVGRYVNSAQQVFDQGTVPSEITYAETPGFFILSGAFHEITALPATEGHLFVAVLIVTSPIVLLLCIDNIFQSISSRVAQLSALTFATTAYTINRGVLPHTTSFFYIHTAIVVFVIFAVLLNRSRVRYAFIGWLVLIAATIGHTFSGGAPLILLLTSSMLFLLYIGIYRSQIEIKRVQGVISFASVYAIAFFGYELYVRGATEVFRRASQTIISLYAFIVPASESGSGSSGSTSGGTSGGYYSSLPFELLIQATAGELLLFFLVFGGICILAFRNEFDLDMVILWLGGGFLLLALAVFFVKDIPAQRFYQILVIFGMTIAAAVMVFSLTKSSRSRYRPVILFFVIFIFAICSLISPIAGMAMSPMTTDIPTDDGLYNTAFDDRNSDWINKYISGQQVDWSNLPLTQIGENTAMIDREQLHSGDAFRYSSSHANTGIQSESASDLGGAERTFLEWNPESNADHIVYSNGKSRTVIRS